MIIKELRIWFNDDWMLTAKGEDATNAAIELQEYSRTGLPLFIEPVSGTFYATSQISSFTILQEDTKEAQTL